MSYRIRYEVRQRLNWKWMAVGICAGVVLWYATAMVPVWSRVAAGEGLYNTMARYVGGMIRGAH